MARTKQTGGHATLSSVHTEVPTPQKAAWGSDKTLEFDNIGEDSPSREPPKGCCFSIISCIAGLWATTEIASKKNTKVYVITSLRELIIYLLFLLILSMINFGTSDSIMFYYTKVMKQIFMEEKYKDTRNTFRGSTQVMDIWRFTEGPLMDGLYWKYDFQPLDEQFVRSGDTADHRKVLFDNRLLGLPRIKQNRITRTCCEVPKTFEEYIPYCFVSYDPDCEDHETYGPRTSNLTAWHYSDKKEINGSEQFAKLHRYSGSGYSVNLHKNRGKTTEIIKELRTEGWVTRETRAIIIDFTIYNANINLFSIISLVFELPGSGGVIPSFEFSTVRLLRYVTEWDFLVLGCEFLFCFFIIFYIIEEIVEIAKIGCKYFHKFWNLLDIVVILLSLATITFSIFRYFEVDAKLASLLENDNQFTDFSALGYWETIFGNVVALTTFVAWIKLFKYIRFNKTMAQLNTTMSKCGKDLLGFSIMFLIVFLAYALLGHLLFGSQVLDYYTYGMSIFTLMRVILGDFDFPEIERANRILGPIYFVTYIFFVYFVLLNMFLAIINDTYTEVKLKKLADKDSYSLREYLRSLRGKHESRNQLTDIQNVLRNSKTDVTFDTLRSDLKKHNFSDMEVEMFLAEYDLDGDRILGHDEKCTMIVDLERRKRLLDLEIAKHETDIMAMQSPSAAVSIDGGVTEENMDQLRSRVTNVDRTIKNVNKKIDTVLSKISKMEK